jgi:hypothetical protein
MMNWKGRGRMLSGPNLRYYSGICVEGLSKPQRISVSIAGLCAEILTRDLPNAKKEC